MILNFFKQRALLVSGLLLAFNVSAYDVVAKTNWSTLKKDGWVSVDGFDDEKMNRMLPHKTDIIENYPWTNQFLTRAGWDSGFFFLANKKAKTLKYIDVSAKTGTRVELSAVYQGEDTGNGCYFSVIDRTPIIFDRTKKPIVLATFPENCINKKLQAAIKARQVETERKINQAIAKETLRRLCKRDGSC